MTIGVNNGVPFRDGAVPIYQIADGGTGQTTASAALAALGGINAADHNGLDHTSAPLNLLTQALHAITSHAGVAGLDNKNTLVMTGDEALTDSSAAFQILNTNGAERRVTLPLIAVTNPAFVLINIGFYLIRVVDSTGRYVIDVHPDQAVRVFSDGSAAWRVGFREDHTQDLTGQIYSFGGDLGGANQFFRPNGQFDTGNAGSTVDGVGTYHVIQVAGTIDEVSYYLGAETQTETLEVFLNGTLVRTIGVNGAGDPNNGGGKVRIVPLGVVANDRLAVRSQTATATCMFQFRVRNTTDGYICQFGGNITADDAYYGVAENASTGKGVTTANADHIVTLYAPLSGGNLTRIAYSIQNADTADQIDIFVGGVLVETVTLASGVVVNGALVGSETLATSPFSNGDTLAIRGKDQANMDVGVVSILSDVPGHLMHFKGNPGARVYWEVWHENVGDGGGDIANARTHGVVQRRGRAILTWYATSTPTAGFVVSRKRDRRTETAVVDVTVGQFGAAMVPLTFEPGDYAQVSTIDGGGGNTALAIIIQ
jgi:hypothetical protein